jgi:peptidoglycan hydrolase CwlO-like protein
MSDLSTKKQQLGKLREDLANFESRLDDFYESLSECKRKQDRDLRKGQIKDLNTQVQRVKSQIQILNQEIYDAEHPPLYQRLKTKLFSKRGRSQSVSQ